MDPLPSEEEILNKLKEILDELPLEVFLYICDYLPNSSIIKCKRVCKKWNKFVDFYRIKKLIITRQRNKDQNYLISLNLSLRDDFRIFKDKLLIMKLFKDLKSLNIYCNNYDINNLTYLTVFINLEQLYLGAQLVINSNSAIYLPNLKILFIRFIVYDEELFGYQEQVTNQIKIDCIQLEYLKFGGFSKYVKVIHPQSIKHLNRSFKDHQYFLDDDYTDEDLIPQADTNLSEYTNLVNLDCDDLETFLNFNILSTVPNLLKLNLILDLTEINLVDFRERLSDLFNLKNELDLNDLQIYINNIELNNLNDLVNVFFVN